MVLQKFNIEAKNLMIKANKIEFLVKKNPQFSINITTDFIIREITIIN